MTAYIATYIHTYNVIHTYIHAYIHIHTHIHTHTYTYTHIPSLLVMITGTSLFSTMTQVDPSPLILTVKSLVSIV